MTRPAAHSGEVLLAFRRLKASFATVAVFSGFLNLMMLAPSLYMLQVYDRVLGSRNEDTLLALTLLLLGIYAFMALLEAIRSWILVRVGARFDAALNNRVFDATYQRSLASPGTAAAQPINDLNALRQTLTGPALLTLFDAPWMPIYLVVTALLSPELAVFGLLSALVLGLLALLNERLSKPRLEQAQQINSQALTMLVNRLRNAEVIQALGMLRPIRERWRALHLGQLRLQAQASDQGAAMTGVTRFVRLSTQSLALGFGALLVLEGRLSAGGMIAASVLISRALAPVEQLIGSWRQIIQGRSAYRRLSDLLAEHPVPTAGLALPAPTGALRFDAVTAAAPGSTQPILRDLSFALAAGSSVAVIGPSGAGKSTLARVLVGVWPTVSGSARLDGAEIYRWNRDELGPHLGYLPQDLELFDGTAAENIARFGAVDSERVVAAARLAGIHEMILRWPAGYDTPLGVGASTLSGGQRQRLGLARALYGEPALVVLDEPGSNLDDQGERALADAVRALGARGCTVVLITHRMRSLALVQQIMVLAEGSIKAFGPRDEVLAALQQANAAASAKMPAPAS